MEDLKRDDLFSVPTRLSEQNRSSDSEAENRVDHLDLIFLRPECFIRLKLSLRQLNGAKIRNRARLISQVTRQNSLDTIITGEPNEFVREIHTRMPVILPEENHDSWLSGEAGKEILVPYPAERMKAWPISDRVNSPKNDDAEMIAPVELTIRVSQPENQPQLL